MNAEEERADSVALSYGLPDELARPAAEQLRDSLAALWHAAFGRQAGGLRPDLEALRKYFDPVAQGKRLRTALLQIEKVSVQGSLANVQALRVDGDRLLISPEGRVALELVVRGLKAGEGPVIVDQAAALRWERDLLSLYREWGRHRLNSVIDLLGGGDKPLQLPSIGAALTLLINRSDSPERAITRFPPGTARDVVDRVFRTCADAFAQQIVSSERRVPDKERLIGGWLLGEISRRVPDALHSSDEEGVFVERARRGDLIRLVAGELRRRDVELRTFEDAFDTLVLELRQHSQELAGYGLLFERPANTRDLRRDLVAAWAAAG